MAGKTEGKVKETPRKKDRNGPVNLVSVALSSRPRFLVFLLLVCEDAQVFCQWDDAQVRGCRVVLGHFRA